MKKRNLSRNSNGHNLSHEGPIQAHHIFRQMKSRCYTQIPEHELVRMVVTGLDFSIRMALVNRQVRDMAQLANRVS